MNYIHHEISGVNWCMCVCVCVCIYIVCVCVCIHCVCVSVCIHCVCLCLCAGCLSEWAGGGGTVQPVAGGTVNQGSRAGEPTGHQGSYWRATPCLCVATPNKLHNHQTLKWCCYSTHTSHWRKVCEGVLKTRLYASELVLAFSLNFATAPVMPVCVWGHEMCSGQNCDCCSQYGEHNDWWSLLWTTALSE